MKILIIGATSAIAEATAQLLAAQGHSLFLIARNAERLQAIANDLQVRFNKPIATFALDLNDFAAHSAAIAKATAALQGLDTVLIAHGSLPEQAACESDFSLIQQAFNTNCLSVISLSNLIAQQFEQQGHGCIAVISSVAGDRGRQSNYIYGSAKGALNIYLQGLRNRLHKANVQVLTIKPGFVDTPMTRDFKKGLLWVKPQTIAKAIVKGITHRRHEIYTPGFWRFIMLIIKFIPECLFKRLKL